MNKSEPSLKRRRKAPPTIHITPIFWGPRDAQIALRLPSIVCAENLWAYDPTFPGVVDPSLGMIALPEAVEAWGKDRVTQLLHMRREGRTDERPKLNLDISYAQGNEDDGDQTLGDPAERAARTTKLLWSDKGRGPG